MKLPNSIPHSLNCPYTTTESDTISLKHYNNKKRSLVRKDKIKKINDNEKRV